MATPGKPIGPPYSLGFVEDIPGEKWIVIGGEYVLFARIVYVDEWQVESLCRMLNLANEIWNKFIAYMKSIGNDPDEFTNAQLKDRYDEWVNVNPEAKGP